MFGDGVKEFITSDADDDVLDQMKNFLKEKYACYVLITCSSPMPDGQMAVEMDFEGDEDLAALLVNNTAQVFDTKNLRKELK